MHGRRIGESEGASAWEMFIRTGAELEKSTWKSDVLVHLETGAS